MGHHSLVSASTHIIRAACPRYCRGSSLLRRSIGVHWRKRRRIDTTQNTQSKPFRRDIQRPRGHKIKFGDLKEFPRLRARIPRPSRFSVADLRCVPLDNTQQLAFHARLGGRRREPFMH